MRQKVILYLNIQFDPITLEVQAFRWEENGDLTLYDRGKYWRFSYNSIKYVYMEVINER